MKKSLLILGLTAFLWMGCKNEPKNDPVNTTDTELAQPSDEAEKAEDSKNDKVFIGEIIFTDKGAVINGKDFIHGVVIDSLANDLAGRIAPIKKDEFDMIPVVIKGNLVPNPDKDGWEELVEITKIINISESKSNNDAIELK